MAGVIGIFGLLAIFYYDYHYYTVEEKEEFDSDSNSGSEDRPLRTPNRVSSQ